METDVAIVGAGAAGLFASVFAARRGVKATAFDGAMKIGAKILVAGGGRCNVTHERVDERDFSGASPHSIRKVLGRFTVDDTVHFFREQGVELKREETGKLFPTTDDAHTVLFALKDAAKAAGVLLVYPWRVASVRKEGDDFVIGREAGGEAVHEFQSRCTARRLILATGGKALPKTGSDGAGYDFAKSLGHSITPLVTPALAPIKFEPGHWVTSLSGITTRARLEVRASSGKRLAGFEDSLLLTHFGISGPAALNISRHLAHARDADPGATLSAHWLPNLGDEQAVDKLLRESGGARASEVLMRAGLAARLADAIAKAAGVDVNQPISRQSREVRLELARQVASCELPATGDRGWLFAEATAGGVPLNEVHLGTMESKVCPGLYLCGELCDVDGRLGGFNFQWAWSSGFVAGTSAAASLLAHAPEE